MKDNNELLQRITDLNEMVLQGKALEAFDTYYHDEVIMQENEEVPVQGKEANRSREFDFFNSITDFREMKPLKVTAGEGVTMVEWFYDFTHQDWGDRTYKQVSVQEWKDGRIIREKFYYGS